MAASVFNRQFPVLLCKGARRFVLKKFFYQYVVGDNAQLTTNH